MRRFLAAAVEINETWFGRIRHLPQAVLDLVTEPSDDEIAAIVEKHCPEETK